MCRRVTNDLETVRIALGNDRHLGVIFNAERSVHDPAIDLTGQSGLRKSWTDGGGKLGNRNGLREFTATAVRQRDDWHEKHPFQWRPLREAA
jgi:hypothetical protein